MNPIWKVRAVARAVTVWIVAAVLVSLAVVTAALAQPAPLKLLDPNDTVILPLDHQTGPFQTVKDVGIQELRTNASVLAKADALQVCVALHERFQWAVTRATQPPSEKPSTSTFLRPSARTKSMACRAIASTVVGVSPVELATPALLNRITGRSAASPSVTAGSQ